MGAIIQQIIQPCPSAFSPCHPRSGTDGLAHDPLARSWALTPQAYAAAARVAAGWGAPLLVLGGGGYDSPAAACAWAGAHLRPAPCPASSFPRQAPQPCLPAALSHRQPALQKAPP